MSEEVQHLQSRIWQEEPEADNPFACRAAYCHGYDVYGEMLGRAGWADMVFLLFRGEAPTRAQAAVLELLAVALASAGPLDPAVHAAMCGGVGGSPAAAALMAALAVGAGGLGGAREVRLAVEGWQACGRDLAAWRRRWTEPSPEPVGMFPAAEHPAGFDPHGVTTATPVRQVLGHLAALTPDSRTAWLEAHREEVERAAGHPLSLVGVAAVALADLGCSPAQAEMLFLLLRLPGAAVHALEQAEYGHKKFPFYALELEDGPTEKAR